VSRFVSKDATRPVDLGPCQCPGTPHERDELRIRARLSYLEIAAVSNGNSPGEVAETFTTGIPPFDGKPVLASWNLRDESGDVALDADALTSLEAATLTLIVNAVSEVIEASGPALLEEQSKNGSGAHSANGSRASASLNRQQRRAAARTS
jgi:hypothetical protein